MYFAFIDHYDSFSLNIVDWLIESQNIAEYIRCDEHLALERVAANPRPLVVSPGPGHPIDYPDTLRLIRSLQGKVPILGVCLGHQMLALANGIPIDRDQKPFHGATKQVVWNSEGHQQSLVRQAISYNSLSVASPKEVPAWMKVLATSDGEVVQAMLLAKSTWQFPALGVQFHPEAFAGDSHDFLRTRWTNMMAEYFSAGA